MLSRKRALTFRAICKHSVSLLLCETASSEVKWSGVECGMESSAELCMSDWMSVCGASVYVYVYVCINISTKRERSIVVNAKWEPKYLHKECHQFKNQLVIAPRFSAWFTLADLSCIRIYMQRLCYKYWPIIVIRKLEHQKYKYGNFLLIIDHLNFMSAFSIRSLNWNGAVVHKGEIIKKGSFFHYIKVSQFN